MLPLITNVHLTLTHRCNLACRYCFVKQEPLDMTWEIAKDSIDFLARNAKASGVKPRICFFGGEPLIMWEPLIVPTVKYIDTWYKDLNFALSITTNGMLLTEDKIAFIKEHKIGILTSIDGDGCTQNYNRPLHNGGESLPLIEPNLKSLLAAGFTPTFRSTIIPDTCGEMYNNYLYAISFGYKSMFLITDAYSTWDENSEKTVRDELYKIADHYIWFWRANKEPPLRMSFLERFFATWRQEQNQKIKGITKMVNPCIARRKCGLGQNSSAAISPAGNIYACQELTSNEGPESIFYIGNIYTGVEDERRLKLAELFDTVPATSEDGCDDCPVKNTCNRGCVANNYMITGKVGTASHGFCFFNKLVHEVAEYISGELKDMPEFIQYVGAISPHRKRTVPENDKSVFTPESLL